MVRKHLASFLSRLGVIAAIAVGSPGALANSCSSYLETLVEQNAYWGRDLKATNFRSWARYKESLGIRFLDYFRPNTLIDLGSGQGYAVREALEKDEFKNAIAIDLHPQDDAPHWSYTPSEILDRITHEEGPAEYILDHYQNRADAIVDNYGAFTYSPARIHLLEKAYAALKPGGIAYFRTPPTNFFIQGSSLIPFEEELAHRFPKIFSVRKTAASPSQGSSEMVESHTVLVMKRSSRLEELSLPYQIIQSDFWSHPSDSKIRFPVLTFSETKTHK
jgi:SAM-dependent methyltransferase